LSGPTGLRLVGDVTCGYLCALPIVIIRAYWFQDDFDIDMLVGRASELKRPEVSGGARVRPTKNRDERSACFCKRLQRFGQMVKSNRSNPAFGAIFRVFHAATQLLTL